MTYTAGAGGLTNGEIDVDVPAAWSAPSTSGSAAGFTTSTCGSVATSTTTIEVTGVTGASASTCTITYGDTSSGGPGATAPSSPGALTFTTHEKSTAAGTLTALTAGSPSATVFAADGGGTLSVAPEIAGFGSSGNTEAFTYTAPAGGLSSGEIAIDVPAAWTTPSTTLTNAGYTTATCGGVAITGNTIRIAGVTLAGGSTCTITYGSKVAGGAGATAPSASGTLEFSAQERSTGTGTLADLGASPSVSTTAADGSGTLTLSPSSVTVATTANTFIATYTAASGGLFHGEIDVAVPADLPAPSTTATDAGFTTSTCGTVAVSGATISVTPVTLVGAATCTITYGSTASGGPGVTAPATAGTLTFTAQQQSTANGTLTSLATSPQLTVAAVVVPPPPGGGGSGSGDGTPDDGGGSPAPGGGQGTLTVPAPTPQPKPKPKAGKLTIGKPTVNRRTGTAKLPFKLSGPGAVVASGTGFGRVSTHAHGTKLSVTIKPTRAALRTLRKKGKLRVTVKVVYTATGAPSTTKTIHMTLVLKRKHVTRAHHR